MPKSNKKSSLIEPQIKDLHAAMHFKSRALLQYDNSNNIEYDTFNSPFKVKPFNVKHFEHNKRQFKHQSFHPTKSLKKALPKTIQSDRVILDGDYLHRDSKLFPSIDSDCEETFNKTDVNR